MVPVDYDSIDLLLQARKISRRQLAKRLGVSPDTLAGSFRRGSKMKVYQLWQIAHILSVNPTDLLSKEADDIDFQKVESEKIQSEYLANDDEIEEIVRILEKLNSKGLSIIKSIAANLSDVSELQTQYKVYHKLFPEHEYHMSPEELDALMNAEKEK